MVCARLSCDQLPHIENEPPAKGVKPAWNDTPPKKLDKKQIQSQLNFSNLKSIFAQKQRRPSRPYYLVLSVPSGWLKHDTLLFIHLPVMNTRSCKLTSRELGGLFAKGNQDLWCLTMYFLNAPRCSESRRRPSELMTRAAPRSLLQEKWNPLNLVINIFIKTDHAEELTAPACKSELWSKCAKYCYKNVFSSQKIKYIKLTR